MTKSRGIHRPRHAWTTAQLWMLRTRFPNERSSDVAAAIGIPVHMVISKATRLGLKKDAAHLASPAAGRIQPGERRGTATQFKPGRVSHNKGRKGWWPAGTERTRFRKGHPSHNARPIGAVRVNSLGYLDRKIRTDKRGGANWRAVHRLVWEAEFGPVPPGHLIAFKRGMRTVEESKITTEILEMITLQENARRNRMWTVYPRELAASIQLLGALRRRIRRQEESHATKD